MPLTVLRATEADTSASVAVEDLAYAGGALDGILFPGPFPAADSSESRPAQLANELRDDPAVTLMKVEDDELTSKGEEGRIAFAKWLVRGEDWEPKERNFGQGANIEACQLLFGQMTKAYNEQWIGKAHVCRLTIVIPSSNVKLRRLTSCRNRSQTSSHQSQAPGEGGGISPHEVSDRRGRPPWLAGISRSH